MKEFRAATEAQVNAVVGMIIGYRGYFESRWGKVPEWKTEGEWHVSVAEPISPLSFWEVPADASWSSRITHRVLRFEKRKFWISNDVRRPYRDEYEVWFNDEAWASYVQHCQLVASIAKEFQ